MNLTAVTMKHVKLTGGPLKEAMDLNAEVLLLLEPDKLLSRFREYAGLTPKAPIYEKGWENAGVAGHSLGHYLSACSMMAASGDERFKPIVDYIVEELAECQNAHGDGFLSAIPRGKEIFQEVKSGDIRTLGFDLNGGWAPLYTMHKLYAGLRDAYRLTGNGQALVVEEKLGRWLVDVFAALNDEQMQLVLRCEYGGINEVLADLAADTGDAVFGELADRMYHRLLLDPLAEGRDELSGFHANTQIPKIIGAARQFEIAGEPKYKRIAEHFWDFVVHDHSYVIGGNSLNEHFGDPGQLNLCLSEGTCETCNTYNMLKLTKHLFGWHALAEQADYYEKAMYNHILASQHKQDGRVVYCLSLEMGGHKRFQTLLEDFTCCYGTGMENHASYGGGIYYEGENDLFVAQYAPSELHWERHGATIVQETAYPLDGRIRLTVRAAADAEFTLHVRYPYWASQGISIRINGNEEAVAGHQPSSFVPLRRKWKDGDCVEIELPMSIRTEAMPDNASRIALLRGPLVLAGDLGELAADADAPTTVLIKQGENELLQSFQELADEPGVYRLTGANEEGDVRLVPFYRLYDRRYTVYWDLFTPEQWDQEKRRYIEALATNRKWDHRTVVFIQPGEMQPERDYEFQGENSHVGEMFGRKFREAWLNGWFSCRIDVLPDEPVELVLTLATIVEPVNRYDVLLDGRALGEPIETLEEEVNRFVQVRYPIPAEWTAGKSRMTLRFQSRTDRKIARVFGIRVLRPEN